MRKTVIIVSVLIYIFISGFNNQIHAQKHQNNYEILLKNGTKTLVENISDFNLKQSVQANEIVNNRFYRLIQFYDIPSRGMLSKIKANGIILMEYIPNKTYLASIPYNESINFEQFGIRSISSFSNIDKLNLRITQSPVPEWTKYKDGIKFNVKCFEDIDINLAASILSNAGYNILEITADQNIISISADQTDVYDIASLPSVRYIDFESTPGEPESDDGRNLHRSNAIDTEYISGKYYDGEGVSVAINDDGFAGPHIDFKGRADQSDVSGDFIGDHGDMTVGIVGAAGNLDPTMRGMAPASFLWVRQYNAGMPNTETLHQNNDVMVFSTSYSNGCNDGYTNTTQLVDEEIYDNPSLMQVFSAGNSNNQDCGYGAGNQWGNITGGHKVGKNVIATANLGNEDDLQSSSSRGPASDGRIKPDISAHGASHWSTDPNNSYAAGGGTSAAAPGIAGVLTQLHHAYRELNSGDDAPSALLKATLMNTANDLGNAGPDFKYGWGKVNALKALSLIEDNRYVSDTITQNGTDNHIIAIPSDVQEVRIMVYWNDVEGSTSSTFALVNDLDMLVTGPTGITWQPLVLDHTPNAALLDLPAVPGHDSINNVEQVRLNTPIAGNYTVSIDGSVIPFGVQEYYLVYEYLFDDITVIYPLGGEGLEPGASERIHWDAHGNTGNFTVDYSTDNGTTWTNISTTVPGDERFVDFPIPNVLTSQALVKVSRNFISDMSDANFSIIGIPQNINVTSICTGFGTIGLTWDTVPGATSYDVYVLGNTHMDSVMNTIDNSADVALVNVLDDHWFSVRARGANGEVGRRAIAINSQTGACLLDCISEDDAGISQIISPLDYSESCAGSTFDVIVELVNIGPNNQSGFTVNYQLGSLAVVSQTYTDTLFATSNSIFTFTNQLTISSGGTFDFKVWTELLNDGANCNDTIEMTLVYQDLIAAFPYTEDFESGLFPPEKMTINNPDQSITWAETIVTGSTGTQSTVAFVNNYNYNSQGQEDELVIAGFDLTNAGLITLTFDVAYAQYSSSYEDGLRVEVSTDCGLTYTTVYSKIGSALATASISSSIWEPSSAGDWRNETIDMSPYLGGMAKIKFVSITDYGNTLLIDNIMIEDVTAPPVAAFISNVNSSCDGAISFMDLSQNSPQQWEWDFGDGNFSTLQNPIHNYQSNGTYDVTLIVHSSLGSDTIMQSGFITIDLPDVPVAQNAVACYGETVEISATGNGTDIYWYENSVLVHQGNTFTTPVITSNTTYQVENVISEPTVYVGPQDNTIGGGSYHGSTFIGTVNFNAEIGFTFVSAWVDAEVDGMRTFYLWDEISGDGNIVDEVTVYIPMGQGRIDLNLTVPGPGTYSIGGSNVDLYRNNSGASYPYILPGVVSLNGSSANSGGDYYYYLYDFEILKQPCTSQAVDVLVSVLDPQFTYTLTDGTVTFTDGTVDANSWLWNFGDGTTSTDQNPVHTYSTSGNYEVSLTVNGNCSMSEQLDITVNGIYSLDSGNSLLVSPIPTKDVVNLNFKNPLDKDLILKVYNAEASLINEIIIPAGSMLNKVDLSGNAAGTYYFRLQNDSNNQLLKVIKTD